MPRGQLGKSILSGLLAGLAVTLAVIFWGVLQEPGDGIVDAWLLGVATYLALAFCFWAFINLNITSLRIRVLRQALRAGGTIALSDLLHLYSPTERLQRRLERLAEGGQLVRSGDRWCLGKGPVLLIARTMTLLRWLIVPVDKRTRA
jgi:hypothetical protein